MYCRFCGAQMEDGAQFCALCGKAQEAALKKSSAKGASVLRIVSGIVFILGGILPYVLPGDLEKYYSYLSFVYDKYPSEKAMAAVSAFTQFSSSFSPIFYFLASALAVGIGVILLKNDSKLNFSLIAGAIVHGASVVYTGFVNLMIYALPQFVLSIYIPDAAVIEEGIKIIREEKELLYYYQDSAVFRLVISVIVIALSVVLVMMRKQCNADEAAGKLKPATLSSGLMVLSVAFLSVVSSLSSVFSGKFFGSTALAAASASNQNFYLKLSPAAVFLFFVIICISVIFTKTKKWILAIPVVSVVATLWIVAFIFAKSMVQEMGTMPEMLYYAVRDLRGMITSCALILIALFFWFSAISRNTMPMWLQVALPVAIPVIYIITELFMFAMFKVKMGFSFGGFIVALLTAVLPLVIRKKVKE